MIAVALLVLHAPDGHEIRVNPAFVTTLHATRPSGSPNKLMTDEIQCVVYLTDGKYVSVVEPCADVQRMLEGKP